MPEKAADIFLRTGVLTKQGLQAAQALKQRDGGTISEAILRLGLLDEEHLVAAFQKNLMIPRVSAAALARVPRDVLSTVPPHMAAELRVIPTDIDSTGNLTLAMVDPTDDRAADEVAAYTQRQVQRAVASPTAMREALRTHYGVFLNKPGSGTASPGAASGAVAPVKPAASSVSSPAAADASPPSEPAPAAAAPAPAQAPAAAVAAPAAAAKPAAVAAPAAAAKPAAAAPAAAAKPAAAVAAPAAAAKPAAAAPAAAKPTAAAPAAAAKPAAAAPAAAAKPAAAAPAAAAKPAAAAPAAAAKPAAAAPAAAAKPAAAAPAAAAKPAAAAPAAAAKPAAAAPAAAAKPAAAAPAAAAKPAAAAPAAAAKPAAAAPAAAAKPAAAAPVAAKPAAAAPAAAAKPAAAAAPVAAAKPVTAAPAAGIKPVTAAPAAGIKPVAAAPAAAAKPVTAAPAAAAKPAAPEPPPQDVDPHALAALARALNPGGAPKAPAAGEAASGPPPEAARFAKYIDRMRAATERDEVVSALLDSAAEIAECAALFVSQQKQLVCLDGRGPDHVVMGMKWFSVTSEEQSPFNEVMASREPHIGPLPDTPANRSAMASLNSSTGALLLLPITVSSRAIGVLYADELKTDLKPLTGALKYLAQETGANIARIILLKKKNG